MKEIRIICNSQRVAKIGKTLLHKFDNCDMSRENILKYRNINFSGKINSTHHMKKHEQLEMDSKNENSIFLCSSIFFNSYFIDLFIIYLFIHLFCKRGINLILRSVLKSVKKQQKVPIIVFFVFMLQNLWKFDLQKKRVHFLMTCPDNVNYNL